MTAVSAGGAVKLKGGRSSDLFELDQKAGGCVDEFDTADALEHVPEVLSR
jgi:hypothetical protein